MFVPRPASASTVATNWSANSTTSVGHHVPNRHIPVIKGDVNFVHQSTSTQFDDNDRSIPSSSIKETLDRLRQLSISSIDYEDSLEFLYDLFYMHSLANQDDSRIARLFIDNDYVAIIHQNLIEFLRQGIFSSAPIRRCTQFILYTLWNFTGISLEFRLYVTNQRSFVQFLLDDFLNLCLTSKTEGNVLLVLVLNNLTQAVISILHNLTLSVHHLNIDTTFHRLEELLFKQEISKNNERFCLTMFLCLIHLNAREVYQSYKQGKRDDMYSSLIRLVFRYLKKIVQQEILMIRTGLSAWVLVNAINKLPVDLILQDDNRLFSLMILFKRGMREEKLQANFALNRAIQQSTHAKELVEKDSTCLNLLQQYQVFLDGENK